MREQLRQQSIRFIVNQRTGKGEGLQDKLEAVVPSHAERSKDLEKNIDGSLTGACPFFRK